VRFREIDGLRGLAVLAVVTYHMSINASRPFALGARGVDLFFVISGLCLSLPSLTRLHAGKPFEFGLSRFALNRLWRIAPPYWVAIALFGLLSVTPFGVPSNGGSAHPLELAQDASIFLTGLRPTYNPSFWTLGIEARWYLVFPAVLLVYTKSKLGFAAIAVIAYIWYNSPFRSLCSRPCSPCDLGARGNRCVHHRRLRRTHLRSRSANLAGSSVSNRDRRVGGWKQSYVVVAIGLRWRGIVQYLSRSRSDNDVARTQGLKSVAFSLRRGLRRHTLLGLYRNSSAQNERSLEASADGYRHAKPSEQSPSRNLDLIGPLS
jgi:hypothetical protein